MIYLITIALAAALLLSSARRNAYEFIRVRSANRFSKRRK